jgi:hypothetical protein
MLGHAMAGNLQDQGAESFDQSVLFGDVYEVIRSEITS